MNERPMPACAHRRGAPRSGDAGRRVRDRGSLLCVVIPLALFYFAWLLAPERVGQPVLYGLLIAAELFNLAQAIGFWWTCAGERVAAAGVGLSGAPPQVDVLIPVYDEPVAIVEPTVAAATRMAGADVRVWLLDDGGSRRDARARRALRRRATCAATAATGAKAGNINHALRARRRAVRARARLRPRARRRTSSRRRSATSPTSASRSCRRRSTTRTPDRGEIPAAAWSQQALFFGPIARGKDGHGAMFCCGTNVVFRRAALGRRRRLPAGLGHRGLRAVDRGCTSAAGARATSPRCSRTGSGRRTWRPTSASSSAGRAAAWRALGAVLRARLPLRLKLQYALSASYFLSGLDRARLHVVPRRADPDRRPAARRPRRPTSSSRHFAPYFGMALLGAHVARRRRVHVQGVRAADGELLDPRAVRPCSRCCGRRGGSS